MSDEEHHFESKADAGASKTYPQQAGTIRKNGYIVIKNRPCKVYLCFFFFLVTDFYLVFCCFYQISCVFFLIWLSFFIKFNFKEVISSKFNVWMYWELIKSVWVCYKKVDFDFGVDGVPEICCFLVGVLCIWKLSIFQACLFGFVMCVWAF
jgi:hypothetical protein